MRLVREGTIVEKVNVNQWYWFPVTGPDYPGIGHYVIVDADGTTVCNPSPMGQANAYLIAAAPDLLAALQRLVHPMADDTDMDNARDVIARAMGAAVEPLYMNVHTGSTGHYADWEYVDESGAVVNAVDRGEVVQVRMVNGQWEAA